MTETKEQYKTGLPPLFPGDTITVEPTQIQIFDGDMATVTLRVTKFTTEWELVRQGAGDYTADKVRGFMECVPVNLDADVNVSHATALQEQGGDLAIIGEVFRQTSRQLGVKVVGLMVDHFKELDAIKTTTAKVAPKPEPRVIVPAKKEDSKVTEL